MNKIIFPLKSRMKGSKVADLRLESFTSAVTATGGKTPTERLILREVL